MEIPMRVVSEEAKDLKLEGDGWKLITEEEHSSSPFDELKELIMQSIYSGKAFNKLIELAQRQGADASYLYDLEKLEKAPIIVPVISEKSGYVKELNAGKVGKLSVELGAGRIRKEDEVDKRVGIILAKKI